MRQQRPHFSRPLALPGLICMAALILGACSTQLTQGALSKSDADALESFPFGVWDELTRQHVDDKGRADYTAIQANPEALNKYVATLATVGPTGYKKLFPSKDAELAYVINGYNALAMFNVLSRYPDIQGLDGVLAQKNFFYDTYLNIDGRNINLYDLENEVARPLARGAYKAEGKCTKLGRVHFALNCASGGCPQLPAEAFTPENVDAQLDRETRKFVREARNVSVDHGKRVITLSMIFKWYEDDFTNDACEKMNRLAWINLYLGENEQIPTDYELEFREYDWRLNDQKLYKD